MSGLSKFVRPMVAATFLAMSGPAALGQTPAAPVAPTALPIWMAGCWITEADASGARSEECWTVPRGEMMLGSGHHFNGARTLSFEHMRIERVDGALVFVALPGGETPTRFAGQPSAANDGQGDSVLFVNVDNGYPQRIRYWRDGEQLLAEISFLDGRERVRWRFRRAG